MKSIIIPILLITLSHLMMAQVDIKGAVCEHCNMSIDDPAFIAEAVHKDYSRVKFDAIECLVNFLKENNEDNYVQFLVADYGNPGARVSAKTATYLISRKIPSPMGAYLSAFGNIETAQNVQKEKGGDLLNWDELLNRFKDSRFGLMDHPTHHHSPGAYAPAGIMGDHLHHARGLMLSVRSMYMTMNGNLNGKDTEDDQSILGMHMVSPQDMTMQMTMVGVMYAPSDRITLMAMQNYGSNRMESTDRMGMSFTTNSIGWGDLSLGALVGLWSGLEHSLLLNSGVSIPIGALDRRDDTPMMDEMKLPYPMQLGSGTWDYQIGFTYKGKNDRLNWGIQQKSNFRTGQNDEGYALGNWQNANAWLGFQVTSFISTSIRMEGVHQQKIRGVDHELNPMMSPLANKLNSGFTRVRSFAGANLSFGRNVFLRDLTLGLEFGVPVYQVVEGIQMNEQFNLNTILRYSI